jgi:Putative Flp pilus-assembly TadE/G-like
MTRKTEAGQALALTAVALIVVLGITGMSIDMGVLRYQKRLEQSAADAAAIAGSENLMYDTAGSSGIIDGAQAAAAIDGFTSISGVTCPSSTAGLPTNLAVGTVKVTVCNPPIAGPHAGDSDYVETYVSVGQPTYFARIFGARSETIVARAVATNLGGGADSGCLFSLGPPSASIEGVNINGNASLYAPSCGIVDNGNYNTAGNSLDLTAETFGMSGNRYSTGQGGTVTCIETPNSCPTGGMSAVSDPLFGLAAPTPSATPYTVNIAGSGDPTCGTGCTYHSATNTYEISEGTYCSITIQGVSTDNVVFDPGTYIIDGTYSGTTSSCTTQSLNIPGNATITGDGVFFYFMNTSTLNMTGTPLIQLTAPSTGTYAGILFYQDPNDTNTTGPSLGGNTGSYFDGTLYFPKDQLTFYGHNVSYAVGIVIEYSLLLSGNPDVTINGPGGMPNGVNPIKNAILVE